MSKMHIIILMVFLWSQAIFGQTAPAEKKNEDAQNRKIQQLIKDLGSENYETRTRATNELNKIGVAAKDQLIKATESSDLEVSTRAWEVLLNIARQILRTNPRFVGVKVHDGIDPTGVTNVTISEVVKGGPAEKAGLKVGDIITKLNNQMLTNFNMLQEWVQLFDVLKVEIIRDKKTMQIEIQVVKDGKIFKPPKEPEKKQP